MNFAIFGAYGSFDYYKIGGTESFSRRLAAGLQRNGQKVDFVIYGAPTNRYQVVPGGSGLYYFPDLRPALQHLSTRYDHVLTIYLPPRDRLPYLLFRLRHKHKIMIHQIYFSWPDSQLKLRASFLDAYLLPLNGRLFCISPRLFRYISAWSKRACLLLPPVPENYFLDISRKKRSENIRLTYVGRTEPAKGINEIIEFFTKIKNYPHVNLKICGFHHKHHQAAVKIHEWLSNQQDISYYYTPYDGYNQEVDSNLRSILQDTDILVLPYRQLSSTIDSPLLLLEGMASLCAVLTRSGENIQDIYGDSKFLFSRKEEMFDIINYSIRMPEILETEKQRIYHRNLHLGFNTEQVLHRFLEAVS